MAELNIGDTAPAIDSTDQDGKRISLEEYRGKKVVLYFYPKDNTPGCTAEACDLRDNYALFKARGYEIIGVSADSEKSHRSFIEKYDLPFRLISDTKKEVLEAYGAWGEKKLYGRSYMGIIRMTYVINEQGIIEDIIKQVKTKEHTRQIIKD